MRIVGKNCTQFHQVQKGVLRKVKSGKSNFQISETHSQLVSQEFLQSLISPQKKREREKHIYESFCFFTVKYPIYSLAR